MMRRTVLLSILFVLPSVAVNAQTADDTAAVRAVVNRYEAALRNRNAPMMRDDYAADAVWMDVYGTVRVGPDSIIAITARQHADPGYSGSVARHEVWQQVTFIRPDVAQYQKRDRLENRDAVDGSMVPVHEAVTILLLSREAGRWIIRRETSADLRLSPVSVADGAMPPSGVYNDGQVDQKVLQTGCSAPRYPVELRTARVNGSVNLHYVVGVDGRIEAASLKVVSSTNKAFEQPAIDAVLTCTSRPASIKGMPVRQLVDQVVRFAIG